MKNGNCKVRVLFSCTGVGILNRGIESFFREAYDGLKDAPELEAWLIKGNGERTEREIPVWCLPRTGWQARWVGRLIHRNSYIAEQLSSFLPVAREVRRLRPDVIFYSDANLGFQLFFRRKWIGVPYRLLFSNGGPVGPPFNRTDCVHQVAPLYHSEAIAFGEPAAKHFLVPYGIRIPPPPGSEPSVKRALRARLNIPLDRPVVLSVGWISREHKRMHYVIEEIARLPQPRPFLQMLGAMDESSREITELADQLLGHDGYSAKSVPYQEVFDYYRAADVFVLGSLIEGFGRVYIEALLHGLPVIAHRHPVMEYVLGEEGTFTDLGRPGALAALLPRELSACSDERLAERRWKNVSNRFSWSQLRPEYCRMFHGASGAARNVHACESHG
jgi:glycosyltransferase involved in cell wall biosynthesis